jgi:hypothetical protein
MVGVGNGRADLESRNAENSTRLFQLEQLMAFLKDETETHISAGGEELATPMLLLGLSMATAPPMTKHPRLLPRLALAVVALILITTSAPSAQPVAPKPLPEPVQSKAPGIRPLGRGRQTVWGVRVYDATLWVVGDRFTPAQPHAIDVEPGRSVSADTLVYMR